MIMGIMETYEDVCERVKELTAPVSLVCYVLAVAALMQKSAIINGFCSVFNSVLERIISVWHFVKDFPNGWGSLGWIHFCSVWAAEYTKLEVVLQIVLVS